MSVDVSQLPPDLRALIDAAVADALKPVPPKVLTPAEEAAAYLQAAVLAERGDHAIPTGSAATHAAIIALLHLLVDRVYPSEDAEVS